MAPWKGRPSGVGHLAAGGRCAASAAVLLARRGTRGDLPGEQLRTCVARFSNATAARRRRARPGAQRARRTFSRMSRHCSQSPLAAALHDLCSRCTSKHSTQQKVLSHATHASWREMMTEPLRLPGRLLLRGGSTARHTPSSAPRAPSAQGHSRSRMFRICMTGRSRDTQCSACVAGAPCVRVSSRALPACLRNSKHRLKAARAFLRRDRLPRRAVKFESNEATTLGQLSSTGL
jgi:hypothetical protein